MKRERINCYEPSSEEYFFYEWMIIEKKITQDRLQLLTPEEFKDLQIEYKNFMNKVRFQFDIEGR